MSWLKDLEQALTGEGDKVPAGWVSSQQAAKAWGLRRFGALKRLKRGVADGLVEVRKFRVKINGRIAVVPHYYKTKKL